MPAGKPQQSQRSGKASTRITTEWEASNTGLPSGLPLFAVRACLKTSIGLSNPLTAGPFPTAGRVLEVGFETRSKLLSTPVRCFRVLVVHSPFESAAAVLHQPVSSSGSERVGAWILEVKSSL